MWMEDPRGLGRVMVTGVGPSLTWQQEGTADLGEFPLLEQAMSQMLP